MTEPTRTRRTTSPAIPAANPQAAQGDLDEITFATLIDRPGKIICMGLNYADHAKEGGHARPDYPITWVGENINFIIIFSSYNHLITIL